jgi:hypothetical protein
MILDKPQKAPKLTKLEQRVVNLWKSAAMESISAEKSPMILQKPTKAPRSPAKPLRRVRPRKVRRSTVAALKRKLWALVSKYVRERDDHTCKTCPWPEVGDQAGHFYSRSIASTWIDPKNLAAQCARCNLQLHGNPGSFADYIVSTYGPEELVRLTIRARCIKQWKAPELENLILAIQHSPAHFESLYYENNL